jgi:hypothetical protein
MFPPTAKNMGLFRTEEWGHRFNTAIEVLIRNGEDVHLMVTTPGNILVQPANWIHFVITVSAPTVAIHNTVELVHVDSVADTLERFIPDLVENLKQAPTADKMSVEEVAMVLRQDVVRRGMPSRSIARLRNMVASVPVSEE